MDAFQVSVPCRMSCFPLIHCDINKIRNSTYCTVFIHSKESQLFQEKKSNPFIQMCVCVPLWYSIIHVLFVSWDKCGHVCDMSPLCHMCLLPTSREPQNV